MDRMLRSRRSTTEERTSSDNPTISSQQTSVVVKLEEDEEKKNPATSCKTVREEVEEECVGEKSPADNNDDNHCDNPLSTEIKTDIHSAEQDKNALKTTETDDVLLDVSPEEVGGATTPPQPKRGRGRPKKIKRAPPPRAKLTTTASSKHEKTSESVKTTTNNKKEAQVLMMDAMLSKSAVCEECGMGFRRQATLQMHMKRSHGRKFPQQPPQQESPSTVPPSSSTAEGVDEGKTTTPPPKKIKRQASSHKKVGRGAAAFSPSKCRPDFIPFTRKRPSLPSLALKNPVTCSQCGMTFTRRAHLNRHMLLHSGVKPFQCEICLIRFTRKDHMLAHRVKHEKSANGGDNKICCSHCHTSFLSWKNLEKHVESVHGDILQSVRLAAEKNLLMEEDGEEGEGHKFLCDHCPKSFSQRRYLRAHRKLHFPREKSVADDFLNDDEDNEDLLKPLTAKAAALSQQHRAAANFSPVSNRVAQLATTSNTTTGNDGQGKIAECSVCGRTFGSRAQLRKHYKVHKRRFICRFCGLQLASAGSLMRHNLTHTGRKEFRCGVTGCGRTFSRKDTLAVHVEAHKKSLGIGGQQQLSRPFKCKWCCSSYTLKYNLVRHVQMVHNNGGGSSSSSRVTEAEFEPLEETEKKMVITLNPFDLDFGAGNNSGEEGEEDKFECGHCDKVFKNSKSLNTHKWYHSRDKQFVCPICHRGFKYSTDLGRHINTHTTTGGRDKIPEEMEKKKSGMEVEQSNIVTISRVDPGPKARKINPMEARPYGCRICPQRFNHRSNLSRHLRLIHNATSPRKRRRSASDPSEISVSNYNHHPNNNNNNNNNNNCEGSSLLLESSEDIQSSSEGKSFLGSTVNSCCHSFSNSARPFCCNLCGKNFENKSSLWTHMRVHNKSFQCELCSLKVASRGDLILHLRTHTGEKPYSCPECEWKFSRRSGLTKHLLKHHGGDTGSSARFIGSGGGMEISKIPFLPGGGGRFPAPGLTTPPTMNSLSHPHLTVSPCTNNSSLDYLARPSNPYKFMLQKKQEEMFSCRQCSVIVTGREKYLEHLKTQHPEEEVGEKSVNSCQRCGEAFQNHSLLGQHNSLCQGELDDNQGRGNREQTTPTQCKICGKICSSLGFLSRHYQYMHPEEERLVVEQNSSSKNSTVSSSSNNCGGKSKKDNDNEEEEDDDDDEEFPEESEGPPNKIRADGYFPAPPTSSMMLSSEEEEEEEEGLEQQHFQVFDSGDEISTATVLPAPCERCGKQFTSKKARSDHIWYCKRAKLFRCPLDSCSKQFKLRHDVTRHLSRHFTPSKSPSCPICGEEVAFSHRGDLEEHLSCAHHMSSPSQMLTHLLYSSSSTFAEQQTHTDHHLPKSSLSRSSSPQWTHPESTLEEFEGADEELDADEEEFPDPSTFLEQSMESISTTDQQEQEQYPCLECGKIFSNKQKLGYHKYYHAREPKFPCGNCGEKFKLRSHLQRHQRIYHSGTRSKSNFLSCPQCPRKFTRIHDVNVHLMRAHNNNNNNNNSNNGKNQSISHCSILKINFEGKSTATATATTTATATATTTAEMLPGPNGHLLCNICGKLFKEKKSADAHRYYHGRECKHSCTHCTAKFKQNSDLQRHLRIHHSAGRSGSGAAVALACPHCLRSFTDERYLRMHVKRYHAGGGAAGGGGETQAKLDDDNDKQSSFGSMVELSLVEDEEEHKETMRSWNLHQNSSSSQQEEPTMYYFEEDVEAAAEEEDEDDDADQRWMQEMELRQYQEDFFGLDDNSGQVDVDQISVTCDNCQQHFTDANDIQFHECAFERDLAAGGVTEEPHPPKITCAWCPETFTDVKEKVAHQRAHFEVKPFQCQECEETFLQRTHLHDHLRNVHKQSVEEFQCEHCPKTFYLRKSLVNHVRRLHSQPEQPDSTISQPIPNSAAEEDEKKIKQEEEILKDEDKCLEDKEMNQNHTHHSPIANGKDLADDENSPAEIVKIDREMEIEESRVDKAERTTPTSLNGNDGSH